MRATPPHPQRVFMQQRRSTAACAQMRHDGALDTAVHVWP